MPARPLLQFLLLLILALAGTGAHAQAPPDRPVELRETGLKVGVFVEPPFVINQPLGYTGMAVELWKNIAAKLGLDYSFQEFSSLRELVDATQQADIDVAVAGLAITEDRLQRVDFTQPWLKDGLRIMIEQNRPSGLREMLDGLEQSGHLNVYMWIAAIILLATVLLTLVDRLADQDFTRRWHEGLAESFYHVMSVATSGRTSHKPMFGVPGRVLAALWMVCGVTLIAYITSSITTVMTTNALVSQINGFADLRNKTVGVLKGSVGETYCLNQGIQIISYNDLPEAIDGLLKRQVNAVVHDSPALQYYDLSHPQLPLTEVGESVRPETIGFALPRNSPHVRDLSLAIVGAEEDGLVDRLRMKYLGNP